MSTDLEPFKNSENDPGWLGGSVSVSVEYWKELLTRYILHFKDHHMFSSMYVCLFCGEDLPREWDRKCQYRREIHPY